MIRLARFQQALVGSYRLSGDAREQPLALELRGTGQALVPGLGGRVAVEGEIDANGLASEKPVRGWVELERWVPFAARYELELRADDGRELRLVGERRARLRDLVFSASRVQGRLLDADGQEVGSLELRLDYRRELSRLMPLG